MTLNHVLPLARWVAPFGNLRIKGSSRLPVAYRSVVRPSSPLSAKASTKYPLLLNLIALYLLRAEFVDFVFRCSRTKQYALLLIQQPSSQTTKSFEHFLSFLKKRNNRTDVYLNSVSHTQLKNNTRETKSIRNFSFLFIFFLPSLVKDHDRKR